MVECEVVQMNGSWKKLQVATKEAEQSACFEQACFERALHYSR